MYKKPEKSENWQDTKNIGKISAKLRYTPSFLAFGREVPQQYSYTVVGPNNGLIRGISNESKEAALNDLIAGLKYHNLTGILVLC